MRVREMAESKWIIHSSRPLRLNEIVKLQSVYGPYFYGWTCNCRENNLPETAIVAMGFRDALKYVSLQDLQRNVPCITRIEQLQEEPIMSVQKTILCTILLIVLLLIQRSGNTFIQ